MMKANVLAAALMTACLLTTPAVARPASQRLTANAHLTHGSDRDVCCRHRGSDLRASPDREMWGHLGAYYGPMIHAP
jgi:hypothetical protein